jgi:hypothetical protein
VGATIDRVGDDPTIAALDVAQDVQMSARSSPMLNPSPTHRVRTRYLDLLHQSPSHPAIQSVQTFCRTKRADGDCVMTWLAHLEGLLAAARPAGRRARWRGRPPLALLLEGQLAHGERHLLECAKNCSYGVDFTAPAGSNAIWLGRGLLCA